MERISKTGTRSVFGSVSSPTLNGQIIQEAWYHRNEIMGKERTSQLFNVLAWLLLLSPIYQLVWILSKGGKRRIGLHTSIIVLTIIGCMTEIISRLFALGGCNSAKNITDEYQLFGWYNGNMFDTVGWKSLEIIFTIYVNGMLLYIDLFEWICLWGIMALLYVSIGTAVVGISVFNNIWWARLGLLIAFFSFIDMVFEVVFQLDQKYYELQDMTTGITIGNTCFLLPLWLLLLSRMLDKAPSSSPSSSNNENDAIWNRG